MQLVALAGTVWNPPTSCAWAARVLVDSQVARDHGIDEVGLPSKLAAFSKLSVCLLSDKPRQRRWALPSLRPHPARLPAAPAPSGQVAGRTVVDVHDAEAEAGAVEDSHFVKRRPMFRLALPPGFSDDEAKRPWGPRIRMSLPSFSGRTKLQPELLNYYCGLACRIRVVTPIKLELPPHAHSSADPNAPPEPKIGGSTSCSGGLLDANGSRQLTLQEELLAIIATKPVLALQFDDMTMSVAAPVRVAIAQKKNAQKAGSAGVVGPGPAPPAIPKLA
eukprot:jgi/Mesen1/7178/ME000037S06536